MHRILLCFLTAVFMAAPLAAAPANDSDPEIIKPKGEKRNFTGVYPDHVKTIAVITPGSYPNPKSLKSGVALLRKAGYKVKIYPNVLRRPDGVEKNRYLSCPVEFRVKDFEAAWRDMENDFIICVRGGKGTEDLVDKVNWASLPRRPELYVMGYSDVTMLLCALSGKGYGRPIAGPNVSSHPGLDPAMIPEIKKMFHGEELTPVKLKTLVPGDCSGKALAGLLARFALVSSKNYGLQTKGKILFIESVQVDAETARKQLNTLLKNKFFDGAAGVVFCHFLQGSSQAEYDKMLREIAPLLKVPVYQGYPFGHHARHMAIDYAREAVIKDGVITFPATVKSK